MPGVIVATNRWTGARILSARAVLNAGLVLHLYTAGPPPAPAVVNPASYTEASWDTYLPVNTAGLWQPGSYVQDGEYMSQLGPLTWPVPLVGTQTVRGWWLDDGTWVQFACQLPVPVVVAAGGTPFEVAIRFQSWALAIV
jgi:hypothetical protein